MILAFEQRFDDFFSNIRRRNVFCYVTNTNLETYQIHHDHAILLDHLSLWSGIHGTALNWFKSHLSDRLFFVECSHDVSEPHKSCYRVPQDSALGSLLFTLYTTSLSLLISSLSINTVIIHYHFIGKAVGTQLNKN